MLAYSQTLETHTLPPPGAAAAAFYTNRFFPHLKEALEAPADPRNIRDSTPRTSLNTPPIEIPTHSIVPQQL